MRNHGNWVVSLSELGRFLAEHAEEGGVDAPARDERPSSCSSSTAAVVGIRTGDKGRGRNGEPLAQLRARLRHRRPGDRARRGHRRAPDAAAIDHFGLQGAEPADLGARRQGGLAGPEAAAQDRSTRWGGRCASAAKYGEFGGSFVYPMGEDMVSVGLRRRARVPRRRALRPRPAAGVQDAPADPQASSKAASGSPGEPRRSPRAASSPSRRRLNAPGLLLVGERRRPRQRPAPEGHPLRDRVRPARRRGRRSRRSSAARARPGSARSTPTTSRFARATSGRTSARCATCGRSSTRASSWAARSPAR